MKITPEEKYDQLCLSKYYKEHPEDRAFTYNDLITFGNVCARDCKFTEHIEEPTNVRAADTQDRSEHLALTPTVVVKPKRYKPASASKDRIPAGKITKGKCECKGSGYITDAQGYIISTCGCQKF